MISLILLRNINVTILQQMEPNKVLRLAIAAVKYTICIHILITEIGFCCYMKKQHSIQLTVIYTLGHGTQISTSVE